MLSITRTAAKLCIVTLVLIAFFDVAPVSAASVIFLANPPAGSDSNPCSFALHRLAKRSAAPWTWEK
jgi:hypothetical protein